MARDWRNGGGGLSFLEELKARVAMIDPEPRDLKVVTFLQTLRDHERDPVLTLEVVGKDVISLINGTDLEEAHREARFQTLFQFSSVYKLLQGEQS